jgi:hypothetical protein
MRTAEKSEPKRGSKKPRCDAVNGWPPASSERMFAIERRGQTRYLSRRRLGLNCRFVRLPLQFLFALGAKSSATGASGARTLHGLGTMKRIDYRRLGFRHLHHLIGNALGLPFMLVVRGANPQLGLDNR